MVWGIENPTVKLVEAGEMIRFTYRVIDAEKAKPLNDKKVEPSLICPDRSVKLIIPTLEKVGQLRQSATPENGRSYWMAFSNKGGIVKHGDRVDVIIGNFHAEGLEVEKLRSSATRFSFVRPTTARLSKKAFVFFLVLECFLLARPRATAQDQQAAPDRQHRVRHSPTLDDQLKTLTDSLNLDSTQQGMVKIILERRQSELLDVHKNQSLSAVDRFNAVKAVHERANDRISHILNPEQSKKFDLMRHHAPTPQAPAKPDHQPSATAKQSPEKSDN
jgi:hypothetical protein